MSALAGFMDASNDRVCVVLTCNADDTAKLAAAYPALMSRFRAVEFHRSASEQIDVLRAMAGSHYPLPNDLAFLCSWIERCTRESRWRYLDDVRQVMFRAIEARQQRSNVARDQPLPLERVDFEGAMAHFDQASAPAR
jgi:hypothetical protein